MVHPPSHWRISNNAEYCRRRCHTAIDDDVLTYHQPQSKHRHLLHVFASFGLGGVPIRICDVLNALPEQFRHTIVALDSCFDARRRLGSQVSAEFRDVKLTRYCLPCNLRRFKGVIDGIAPDLLLTYNWGAI